MGTNGPFGLSMGMSLEEIEGEPKEVAPGKFAFSTVPKPHSAFEVYVLQITPKCGLSWIKGIGHTIQTSCYGAELLAVFDSMETKLSAAYGKHNRTDFLMPGSIWDKPREWMQSFLLKERHLMTVWSSEHGSNLGNSIKSVALAVGVVDETSGYILLEYSLDNVDSSNAEIAALEDGNL
jgi:hypothetical protein